MYARMSTTIAETLSEKEFGRHQNTLYRPNSSSSCNVVHPVVCKRDIFVEDVTPTKSKNRRSKSKSSSIYHVSNKAAYIDDITRSNQEAKSQPQKKEQGTSRARISVDTTQQSRRGSVKLQQMKHEIKQQRNDESKSQEERLDEARKATEGSRSSLSVVVDSSNVIVDAPRQSRRGSGKLQQTKHEIPNLVEARKRAEDSRSSLTVVVDSLNVDNIDRTSINRLSRDTMKNPPSYSISASMLFREKKQLKVETGRVESDEGKMLHTNRHRLHLFPHEDHRHLKYGGRFPKYAGTPVSPSSTVSSLSLPLELDFDPTPRAIFHQRMKSPPRLQCITENYMENDLIHHHREGAIMHNPMYETIREEEEELFRDLSEI